jgi:hypothetical protein
MKNVKSSPLIIFIAGLIALGVYIHSGQGTPENVKTETTSTATSHSSINAANKVSVATHSENANSSTHSARANIEKNASQNQLDSLVESDNTDSDDTSTTSSPPAQLYDQTSSEELIDTSVSSASSAAL